MSDANRKKAKDQVVLTDRDALREAFLEAHASQDAKPLDPHDRWAQVCLESAWRHEQRKKELPELMKRMASLLDASGVVLIGVQPDNEFEVTGWGKHDFSPIRMKAFVNRLGPYSQLVWADCPEKNTEAT